MSFNSIQTGYMPPSTNTTTQTTSYHSTYRPMFYPANPDTYAKQNNDGTNKDGKVTFGEGLELVCKGFISKIVNIGKSIIQNPLKTLLIAGSTTLALGALPIIGISTAAGASALALGFATIAASKTIAHTIKAVKHGKNGEHNELRKDLQTIGGDCLDLALSAPFAPKAFKTLKRNIKYAPAIGLNKDLLSNIKNTKGVGKKYAELQKGNLRINYETMGNEMGLKVKPKLVFENMETPKGAGTDIGAYDPVSGDIVLNTKMLKSANQKSLKTHPEAILRHELEHFTQFADAVRTEGIGIKGLQNTLSEYCKKVLENPNLDLPEAAIELAKQMAGGNYSAINSKFYQSVIDSAGVIKAGTKEAIAAKTNLAAFLQKVTADADKIQALGSSATLDQVLEVYRANPLEVLANAKENIFTKGVLKRRPTIPKVLAMEESLRTKN